MINLEDKKKIQEQQKLDTAREILEELNSWRLNHHSSFVVRCTKEFLSQTSIKHLGYNIFSENEE